MFQRALQVAGVRVDAQILVSGGLQRAVPIVDDIVVHVRVGGRLMPLPRPLFQIVVHGVRQVARIHTELLEFGDHVGTFFFGNRRSVRVGIPVDAERDAKSLAFGNVTLRFLVGIVAFAVAEADDRAFHAVGFRFGPIDVALPSGNVDHAFGLLHEQVVLVVEKSFRIVVGAPVRAVIVALEFGCLHFRVGLRGLRLRGFRIRLCRLQRRLFHGLFHGCVGLLGLRFRAICVIRVGYSIFDIFRTDRNEGFAVGFGERIRLLIFRADQCWIGHDFASFDVLDLTFGGDSQIFRNHGGIVGNLVTDVIRKFRIRIVRHAVLRLLAARLIIRLIVRLHNNTIICSNGTALRNSILNRNILQCISRRNRNGSSQRNRRQRSRNLHNMMWRNHSSASLEYSHQPQIFGANALIVNSNCNPQPQHSTSQKF